jgi:ribonuclease HI
MRFFSRARIRQVFKTLSPFKAPGQDKIPNVVYMRCIDALIDHLFFIYRAIFELNTYHPRWLESVTLVLRKIGKTDYNVAKAYRPIGLIDTMPKGFSTLNTKQISYLAEKHNMLPQSQFGGRPGRNTTDAMLLVSHRIKDAWRSKKVAAALFLDVQGVFPNTVKEQLIHNMKMRRVPKCFTDLTDRMLSGRSTRLRFDDFVSDPIPLINGTTQGDPSSMLFYSFYNAPLLETANGRDELSPGFVDDSMMLAIGNDLTECHERLKDMMERPGGGFEWSHTHNSPFEISKIALMNFPRSYRDNIPGDLILDKPNQDGSVVTSSIKAVNSYKYLGVIFDPGLKWTLHHAKVVASATFWSSQIWRISKPASGMSASGVRQLYNTVAVPGFTYGAEVWYTGLSKPVEEGNTRGSVAITNKLKSIQRKVASTITGAIRTTAGDTLDAHANIWPIDLLFNKVLFRAASRLCSLPPPHPLYDTIRAAMRRKVKRHRSPVHHLLYLSRLKPGDIETIKAVRRRPDYQPSFDRFICDTKDDAFTMASVAHINCRYKIYSDGSGYEGGVGASAILYKGEDVIKTLRYYLGTDKCHTVYEAEGIGVSMGLHLLANLNRKLNGAVIMGSDSQALIRATENQRPHAGHYILDEIHNAAEKLHSKQDGLLNRQERLQLVRESRPWSGRKKEVIDLRLIWVPGHHDFAPNERADEEAKKAAQGDSSDPKLLPPYLRKQIPHSISAVRQDFANRLQKRWTRRWKASSRAKSLRSIDNSAPSKKFLKLTKDLNRSQASIIMQLRTGHIGLNQHLFRIKKVESPSCPHCRGLTVETVKHFLLDCPFYRRERHELQSKLRRNAHSISFLLSSPVATKPLLKFVHSTGRFKPFFESGNREQYTNAKYVADKRAEGRAFEQWITDPNTHAQLLANPARRQAPNS